MIKRLQECPASPLALVLEGDTVFDLLDKRIRISLFRNNRPLACTLYWTLDRFINEIAVDLEHCSDFAAAEVLHLRSTQIASEMVTLRCGQVGSMLD